MARPFAPRQVAENAVFLRVLGETGNARLAAREAGRSHGTMHGRRGASAAFAQNWDAAVAAAHARFHLAGGRRGPEGAVSRLGSRQASRQGSRRAEPGGDPSLRTRGGEAVVVRTRTGRLQLRLAHPGKLTPVAEQAFLAALAATCNVRLAAAAAGASPRAFYRRRQADSGFAREMRLALATGYDRLECAALQAAMPEARRQDGWRRRGLLPIPPLTADQALQLLCLHEKSVRQGWEQAHRRRRRGESEEVYGERLRAMWTAEEARTREREALVRAHWWEEDGGWRMDSDPPPPPPLPPLDLVTGWSRARGLPPHHPGVAMFGGWRMRDMKAALRRRGGGCAAGGAEGACRRSLRSPLPPPRVEPR